MNPNPLMHSEHIEAEPPYEAWATGLPYNSHPTQASSSKGAGRRGGLVCLAYEHLKRLSKLG